MTLSNKKTPRHTNDQFPCLVQGGAELEDPAEVKGNPAKLYEYNARNALRFLTYGTPLFKDGFFRWCNLKLAWLNFKALAIKRDPKLLRALREEMKYIFKHALEKIENSNSKAKNRLDIFITTLLSNFPFMDPVDGDTVEIPQKFKDNNNDESWSLVNYRFKKIDISPKNNWQAKLLAPEDKIYAYGLEPYDNALAQPYLLLMGTTYPSGQGSVLSLLSDVTPGLSVGESHDFSELETWIRQHKRIKVTGHSQGGTMAMIVAAKYPRYVAQADCLNPAALLHSTIQRLEDNKELSQHHPKINVYTQKGDPVFFFGDAFLKGTRIYRVEHKDVIQSGQLAAHIHHFSGHIHTDIIHDESEITSRRRHFLHDVKYMADRILSPLLYTKMIYSAGINKIKHFCNKHASILYFLLFSISLATSIALMATGVLAPAGLAMFLGIPVLSNIVLGYSVLSFFSLVISALILPSTLFKLTPYMITFTSFMVAAAATTLATVALTLSAIAAGIKALVTSPLKGKSPTHPGPTNGSTATALDSLHENSSPSPHHAPSLKSESGNNVPSSLLFISSEDKIEDVSSSAKTDSPTPTNKMTI